MNNLCEAFNRINGKFGANRVKLLYFAGTQMTVQIGGLGRFEFDQLPHRDLVCYEMAWVGGHPGLVNITKTPLSIWLAAIANGKVRDNDGNMVDPQHV